MIKSLIDALYHGKIPTKEELIHLISQSEESLIRYLFFRANEKKEETFGKRVFIRGLIEFTNYCKNDCYYCGIRCSNKNVTRYRMTTEEILSSCDVGDKLGIMTYVLQGGEDPFFTDEKVCELIRAIKSKYPEKAITLSIGEKRNESYQKFKEAGADRYLLRHETASCSHYEQLHPKKMNWKTRRDCLNSLLTLGFQTGAGFMVGSPYQTVENLAEDLLYLHQIQPHMVGIGPFIHHNETPFRDFPDGSSQKTLIMVALTRLLLPKALLPSTTALASIPGDGRKQALLAGANVVMPNLTPPATRKNYLLYQNKTAMEEETAENFEKLKQEIASIGLITDLSRGDSPLI